MYIEYNVNPLGKKVEDCVFRALSLALDKTWAQIYIDLCIQGLTKGDRPDANDVWGEYLYENDFLCETVPNFCPNCYTLEKFCKDHNTGEYIVASGTHVVFVKDGDYYDTRDSGDMVVMYYWRRK